MVLEKKLLDHRPIFLLEHIADFGPSSFRLFHYWFELDGFDQIVRDFGLNNLWRWTIYGLYLRKSYNFLNLIYEFGILLLEVG